MDFSSFSDANFDAKAWINDAIKASKSDGTETFVSSMILKLQLLSQEVSSSFEETSSQTLVRMPRALMEIERMSKEAKNLRANLNTLLQGAATPIRLCCHPTVSPALFAKVAIFSFGIDERST